MSRCSVQTFPQEEIANELAVNKGQICGLDNQGRPLLLVIGKLHSRSKRDFDETKRYMCYCLDALLRTCDLKRNPTGKMVSIMDLRGEAKCTPYPYLPSCSDRPLPAASLRAIPLALGPSIEPVCAWLKGSVWM